MANYTSFITKNKENMNNKIQEVINNLETPISNTTMITLPSVCTFEDHQSSYQLSKFYSIKKFQCNQSHSKTRIVTKIDQSSLPFKVPDTLFQTLTMKLKGNDYADNLFPNLINYLNSFHQTKQQYAIQEIENELKLMSQGPITAKTNIKLPSKCGCQGHYQTYYLYNFAITGLPLECSICSSTTSINSINSTIEAIENFFDINPSISNKDKTYLYQLVSSRQIPIDDLVVEYFIDGCGCEYTAVVSTLKKDLEFLIPDGCQKCSNKSNLIEVFNKYVDKNPNQINISQINQIKNSIVPFLSITEASTENLAVSYDCLACYKPIFVNYKVVNSCIYDGQAKIYSTCQDCRNEAKPLSLYQQNLKDKIIGFQQRNFITQISDIDSVLKNNPFEIPFQHTKCGTLQQIHKRTILDQDVNHDIICEICTDREKLFSDIKTIQSKGLISQEEFNRLISLIQSETDLTKKIEYYDIYGHKNVLVLMEQKFRKCTDCSLVESIVYELKNYHFSKFPEVQLNYDSIQKQLLFSKSPLFDQIDINGSIMTGYRLLHKLTGAPKDSEIKDQTFFDLSNAPKDCSNHFGYHAEYICSNSIHRLKSSSNINIPICNTCYPGGRTYEHQVFAILTKLLLRINAFGTKIVMKSNTVIPGSLKLYSDTKLTFRIKSYSKDEEDLQDILVDMDSEGYVVCLYIEVDEFPNHFHNFNTIRLDKIKNKRLLTSPERNVIFRISSTYINKFNSKTLYLLLQNALQMVLTLSTRESTTIIFSDRDRYEPLLASFYKPIFLEDYFSLDTPNLSLESDYAMKPIIQMISYSDFITGFSKDDILVIVENSVLSCFLNGFLIILSSSTSLSACIKNWYTYQNIPHKVFQYEFKEESVDSTVEEILSFGFLGAESILNDKKTSLYDKFNFVNNLFKSTVLKFSK